MFSQSLAVVGAGAETSWNPEPEEKKHIVSATLLKRIGT
jgi:hypothetical protein